ncbi:MAG: tRNA (adenosine(37)-N6)-threonylcarbamoyltransferase complex ATPase subunit type 1 TsaE [Anaerolineae bacterium]
MAPILDGHTLEFVSRSPDQTQRLGARLGALLQGGDVICLEGPLGSGKTCLAQGIGRGWGVGQTLTSPTFVLVREYARPNDTVDAVRLYHVDLYRISSVDEVPGLGVDEFLGDAHGVCVIEWAERARPLVPFEHLWIRLEFASQTRRALHFTAQGERHAALLREFRRVAFGA